MGEIKGMGVLFQVIRTAFVKTNTFVPFLFQKPNAHLNGKLLGSKRAKHQPAG